MVLDKHDLLIVEALRKGCRISLGELSRIVGLSRFTVSARLKKLFKEKVILGPTIVLNPFMIGLERTAFFEFKTNPHEPWLAKLLEKTTACDLLDGITGEYSLFSRFRLVNDEHFSRILKKIDDAMAGSYFKKYRVVNAVQIYKESGVPFKEKRMSHKLDEIDRKLLEILLNQVKYGKTVRPLSTMRLSRLMYTFGIEISQPAVFRRLISLEKSGVILGHTVNVDWAKLGLKTKLIVRIKVNPQVYDTIAREFLASMNEITDLYRTGEEYGLLAIVRVSDVFQYNAFLLKLYGSRDLIDTYTTLVLEERKSTPISWGSKE